MVGGAWSRVTNDSVVSRLEKSRHFSSCDLRDNGGAPDGSRLMFELASQGWDKAATIFTRVHGIYFRLQQAMMAMVGARISLHQAGRD